MSSITPPGDRLDLTAAAQRLLAVREVAETGARMNRHDAAIRYRGALTLWGELTGLPEAESLTYAHQLADPATPRTYAAPIPF